MLKVGSWLSPGVNQAKANIGDETLEGRCSVLEEQHKYGYSRSCVGNRSELYPLYKVILWLCLEDLMQF